MRKAFLRCTRRIRDPLNYLIMQPTDLDQVQCSIATKHTALTTLYIPLHNAQYTLHRRYEAEGFGELLLPPGVAPPAPKPLTPTDADVAPGVAAATRSPTAPFFFGNNPSSSSSSSSGAAGMGKGKHQQQQQQHNSNGSGSGGMNGEDPSESSSAEAVNSLNNTVDAATGQTRVPLALVTLLAGQNEATRPRPGWLERVLDPGPHASLSLRVQVIDRIHWLRTCWNVTTVCRSLCWGRLPQRIYSINLDYKNEVRITGGPPGLEEHVRRLVEYNIRKKAREERGEEEKKKEEKKQQQQQQQQQHKEGGGGDGRVAGELHNDNNNNSGTVEKETYNYNAANAAVRELFKSTTERLPLTIAGGEEQGSEHDASSHTPNSAHHNSNNDNNNRRRYTSLFCVEVPGLDFFMVFRDSGYTLFDEGFVAPAAAETTAASHSNDKNSNNNNNNINTKDNKEYINNNTQDSNNNNSSNKTSPTTTSWKDFFFTVPGKIVEGFLDNESALHRLSLGREVNMLGLGGSVYRQTLWSTPSLPNCGDLCFFCFGELFRKHFGCDPLLGASGTHVVYPLPAPGTTAPDSSLNSDDNDNNNDNNSNKNTNSVHNTSTSINNLDNNGGGAAAGAGGADATPSAVSEWERARGPVPPQPVAAWLVDSVAATHVYRMEGEVEDENEPNSATTYGDRSLTERVQKKAMNRYNNFRDDIRGKTYSEMRGEEMPR